MALYIGFLKGDLSLEEIIKKIVEAIMSLFPSFDMSIFTVLVKMIETFVEMILKTLFGPIYEAIKFIGALVKKAIDGASELIKFLTQEAVQTLADVIALLNELLQAISNIPNFIEAFIASCLKILEEKIKELLELLNISFPDFLSLFTFIFEFIKAFIRAIIEVVVKPIVVTIIEFLSGVVAKAADFVQFVIELISKISSQDWIGIIEAILKFFSIPSLGDLLKGIITPIIEGVKEIAAGVAHFIVTVLGFAGDIAAEIARILSDIPKMINDFIEILIKFFTGGITIDLSFLNIISIIIIPIGAVIGFIGRLLATMTIEQELEIPLPIFDSMGT